MNHKAIEYLAAADPVDGIGKPGAIQPKRTGIKQVPQEKPKTGSGKPGGKKAVVPRRAPSRGKYIDEYARAPR
jgi:hypothetical protein